MRGRKPTLPPLGEVIDLPLSQLRGPDAPKWLDARAKQCWSEVAAILVAKRIYDDDCKHSLAAFCIMHARFLQCEEMIQKLGLEDKEARLWLRISHQSYDRAARLAGELGLTCVSRKRVQRNPAVMTNKFLKKR